MENQFDIRLTDKSALFKFYDVMRQKRDCINLTATKVDISDVINYSVKYFSTIRDEQRRDWFDRLAPHEFAFHDSTTWDKLLADNKDIDIDDPKDMLCLLLQFADNIQLPILYKLDRFFSVCPGRPHCMDLITNIRTAFGLYFILEITDFEWYYISLKFKCMRDEKKKENDDE